MSLVNISINMWLTLILAQYHSDLSATRTGHQERCVHITERWAVELAILTNPTQICSPKLQCYERDIALRRHFYVDDSKTWQLHIWDWQHSRTSRFSVFKSMIAGNGSRIDSWRCSGTMVWSCVCLRIYLKCHDCWYVSWCLSRCCTSVRMSIAHGRANPVDVHQTLNCSDSDSTSTGFCEHGLICLASTTYHNSPMIFFISTDIFFDVNEATE